MALGTTRRLLNMSDGLSCSINKKKLDEYCNELMRFGYANVQICDIADSGIIIFKKSRSEANDLGVLIHKVPYETTQL